MIELFRIGLINWHLLPSMDINVTGDIGIIGENRSGKSTLLDLIQTVVTGNSGRYLRLNASANDSGRKRGARSVHAYCLGRLGPQDVARPEARTYIFLGFRDTDRSERATTIGLALEATERETSERVQAQFITEGLALSVEDLLTTHEDGQEGVRDWSVARPHLERLCEAAGGALRTYRDEPQKFVGDYMKLLSTGNRFVQVDQMLKGFVNAISFEQIPSATEFVRRYLLEADDIRIGQLRQSIATYHDLQKRIVNLREKLEALEEIEQAVGDYEEAVVDQERSRWLEGRAAFDAAFRANRTLRRARDEALGVQADAKRELAEYRRLITEAEEEQGSLQAAILQQTQGGRMGELKQQRKRLQVELGAAIGHIKDLHAGVAAGAEALGLRDAAEALPASLRAGLERLHRAAGTLQPPAWPTEPEAVAVALADPALGGAAATADAVREAADRLVKDTVEPDKQRTDLRQQITDIRTKGVTLDANVASLVEELEERGFRPRVVGHLLKVVDEDWRGAVEALLGRDREAVIVDDAHVDDAIRHLQASRGRLRGCRIVNTRKIDAAKATPEPGTLASVLASDDAVAMAFVIRRIGGVRLADTVQDLHRPGRAIMQDGTYDDGLTVEMREVQGGYRIGVGAGRASLPQLEADVGRLDQEIETLGRRIEAHRRLGNALDRLSAVIGQGDDLIVQCRAAETAQAHLDQVARDMADLERNVDPDLTARLEAIKAQLKGYRAEEKESDFRLRESKRAVGQATEKLNGTEQVPGSKGHCRRTYQVWLTRKSQFDHDQGRTAYAAERQRLSDDLGRLAREARTRADDLREAVETRRGAIFDRYLDFQMRLAGTRSELTREGFNVSRDIGPWVTSSIALIRDTELVHFEAEATEAAEKTRNIFQHSFAYELRKRFGTMHRSLDKLNRTLRDHEFHYEKYRFAAKPVERMREIIALVQASEADDTLFGLLFDQEVDAGHPHAKALQTVRDLLLDDTLDMTEFEDYRRYYSFNLIMKDTKTGRETDLESRRGTGSGAEQQVPFYVAIGSALAAAYHDKAAGDPAAEKGLGLAVFDEAFSKLDGKNQKACMDFYEKLGLQVVVAAPFEKRATLYETMESFVETIRHDDLVDVDFYATGDRTRRAFAEANPANVSLDDFRRFVESEDKTSADAQPV